MVDMNNLYANTQGVQAKGNWPKTDKFALTPEQQELVKQQRQTVTDANQDIYATEAKGTPDPNFFQEAGGAVKGALGGAFGLGKGLIGGALDLMNPWNLGKKFFGKGGDQGQVNQGQGANAGFAGPPDPNAGRNEFFNFAKTFDPSNPEQVGQMQQRLVDAGYGGEGGLGTSGAGGKGVDSIFGKKTEAAYRDYMNKQRVAAGMDPYTYGSQSVDPNEQYYDSSNKALTRYGEEESMARGHSYVDPNTQMPLSSKDATGIFGTTVGEGKVIPIDQSTVNTSPSVLDFVGPPQP